MGWWMGEAEAATADDPAEEMEHMELFLDPREEEGEDGGVWKEKSPLFLAMSAMTASEA